MGDLDKSLTFSLFARPSFIEGIGRIFDLGSSYQVYNRHRTGTDADLNALKRDWLMVGDDIQAAIEDYDKEQVKETESS